MDNLITEFWKIKRYPVIKAGAAMMFLSVFMSYFYSTASTSVGWDFDYFIHQVVQQNCTYFFPVVIMLTASFIISRETTDDTLKSILTVPVNFKKLLIGKFELLFFLSIAFSLINAALTVIMNLLLHFPGMTVYSIIIATGRIIATNILIYLSVLPLIIINTFLFGSSLVGVAVAFVYGYFGTFEAQKTQISADEGKVASVPETASEQKKQPETILGKDNSVSEGTGRKQSVLKALRERQAKLKQEQKSTEQKAQNHKKGEQEL